MKKRLFSLALLLCMLLTLFPMQVFAEVEEAAVDEAVVEEVAAEESVVEEIEPEEPLETISAEEAPELEEAINETVEEVAPAKEATEEEAELEEVTGDALTEEAEDPTEAADAEESDIDTTVEMIPIAGPDAEDAVLETIPVSEPAVQETPVEEPAEEEAVISTEGSLSIIASGECGDNMTYTLDSNGVLTISGTGEMYGTNT